MLQTLSACRLHTETGTIHHPVITIEDGLILSIEAGAAGTRDETNTTLTPAFFDIHTHGAAGHDVMEASPAELSTISTFLAGRGVGRFLATTVTAPVDSTLHALDCLASAIERPNTSGASLAGIHLEGPFLSHAKRGVHPPANLLAPDIDLFDRFFQAARGHIRLMTIAPEVPGALDLIRHAVSLGVKVSLGHTNATAPEALASVEAGAASATHTFNAMRALDHRDPGVLGVILDDDRLFAELICDGIHVAPELVRLWLKAKGSYKAVLVTDGMSATGMPDGTYTLGTFPVTVANGRALHERRLAGSILTMDKAVANLQLFTDASLETATRLATYNPISLLGLGSPLSPGQPASFNVFNAEGHLQSTILYGIPR